MFIPNLMLIAGTGTKSGKTSMACRVIKQNRNLNIVAIKITPHFHETTPGLKAIYQDTGSAIYEETNADSGKDTSRMLHAGAKKVYFAKVSDDNLQFVFERIMDLIPEGSPVICESPALRNFFEPGVFIIMTSSSIHKHKNINHLKGLPHLMFKMEELNDLIRLPVEFKDGKWIISGPPTSDF
jgi:hypothetical protein